MLTAALGVIAALAFVLGLGAVCLWALKRFGAGALASKTRVPLEVVQRIPLGPKTGLAVVRVGERVMALSVGEGGVRQLFELDEVDRQRVIATSTLPVPMVSSAAASASFTMPAALPGKFGAMFRRSLNATNVQAAISQADAEQSAAFLVPSAPRVVVQPFSPAEPSEVPAFLTAAVTTRRGDAITYTPHATSPQSATQQADRDFRAMLGISLGGATRLATFAAAMFLLGATSLSAQAATQSAPPRPATPAAAAAARKPLQAPALPGAPASAATLPAPTAPGAPDFSLPASLQSVTQDLVQKAAAAEAATKPGAAAKPKSRNSRLGATPGADNGAVLTAQAAASRRPMSQMVVDSARDASGRANTASPAPVGTDDAIMRMMPQMDVKLGGDGETGGLRLNGTVGIVVMMGLLTLLPTLLLMMTGFTRILIVLHFLKQAMGTQSAPPAHLLAGMALLLTGFVMTPTLTQVNRQAIEPWLEGKMTQVEMMKTGVKPMREFMLRQTRESDLKTFVEMSRMPRPNTVDDVPLHVLMSAFVASELRTAFQIGFAIYLPFIIIDAVVASVLMSMGMMMLPPAMISLPFKLLLFVLVDGWTLTITSLVQSFK
ncbi:flagellar type III secretion system pore protein FliP [Gemmatimonas groenlandica]|uniref:Flagellar biosynthetic protein FliP n=1 Tax=Gemmatimonas groenlandica TaxID=2732249 RepID=A0A6M4INZ2_9BACT|nr:flagellar type III secretion system pore protein FliP [Gemmatimonas groenlandica]QJR36460.1 flagellar type III secretion system pore protein FliP [Gemmatimonas groenlandica]